MESDITNTLSLFFDPQVPERGLPAGAYRNRDFWDAERDTVFQDNWVFVGFAHELSEPGDAVPVTVAEKPLLLLRNSRDQIAAFHNVCRHRCLTLVDAPKNVGKLLRCPYHAWAYDLDGGLRASPHFGGTDKHEPEGFDRKNHGLVPVRVHVWQDWIFVNLSGEADPFEDYAAPLIKRLQGLDFSRLNPIGSLDFGEVRCNWKFIMENFIEPYHVQFVHARTTSQPLTDHYTIIDGPCLGSAVDLDEETGGTDSLAVSSRYLTLFPNFIIGRYFPDQLGVYLNIPTGPETMVQRRVLYTSEGQTLTEEEVIGLKKLWWDVHKEDHEMTERLQLGRASPVSDAGGVLSPYWEDSVRRFQELVASSVCSGANTSQRRSAGEQT